MTSRYLGVTDAGLQRSLDRFETARPWADDDGKDDGKRTNDAQTPNPASKDLPQLPSEFPANALN